MTTVPVKPPPKQVTPIDLIIAAATSTHAHSQNPRYVTVEWFEDPADRMTIVESWMDQAAANALGGPHGGFAGLAVAPVTLTIESGYRSPEHNARVGGKPKSMHLENGARDYSGTRNGVQLTGLELVSVLQPYRCPYVGGIGVYPNTIHVDVRLPPDGKVENGLLTNTGTPVRWEETRYPKGPHATVASRSKTSGQGLVAPVPEQARGTSHAQSRPGQPRRSVISVARQPAISPAGDVTVKALPGGNSYAVVCPIVFGASGEFGTVEFYANVRFRSKQTAMLRKKPEGEAIATWSGARLTIIGKIGEPVGGFFTGTPLSTDLLGLLTAAESIVRDSGFFIGTDGAPDEVVTHLRGVKDPNALLAYAGRQLETLLRSEDGAQALAYAWEQVETIIAQIGRKR